MSQGVPAADPVGADELVELEDPSVACELPSPDGEPPGFVALPLGDEPAELALAEPLSLLAPEDALESVEDG